MRDMYRSVNVFGARPSLFRSIALSQPRGKPLAVHSTNPMTGFYRNSKCDTSDQDGGSHTVAGVATEAFLDFSAKQGNDLRGIISPGCKWCFCVSRWKEAFLAGPSFTPPVVLEATHEKALDIVSLDDLRKFEYKPGERYEVGR